MRPGVLDCGCLWDGRMLSVSPDCDTAPDDHSLGRVPFVRGGISEWAAAHFSFSRIADDQWLPDEQWFVAGGAPPRHWLWED